MAVKKGGLGRGIDSLIPAPKKSPASDKKAEKTKKAAKPAAEKAAAKKDSVQEVPEATGAPVMLKISSVEPNEGQPRKRFEDASLKELTESIAQYGVIQPLLVQKQGRNYRIIAGERRWRAAMNAGLKEIPAIIRNYSPQEVIEVALIENIQREDLNPIEEAYAYQKLIDDFGLKQEEAARKVSKSRSAVTNSLRLLKLCDKAKEAVIDGSLSAGHAKVILAINDKKLQEQAVSAVIKGDLSVRDTERLVKALLRPVSGKRKVRRKYNESAAYKEIEDKLRNIIGSKVSVVSADNKKGRIEIEYYSPEDLERILDIFESLG